MIVRQDRDGSVGCWLDSSVGPLKGVNGHTAFTLGDVVDFNELTSIARNGSARRRPHCVCDLAAAGA